MMPDDVELVVAAATSGMERRQFVGSSLDVTPEALAQLDLGDKSSRTTLILAVTIACIVLILVFVTTRLLVRRLMTRHFFLDDTLVTVAAFFTIALCAVCLLAIPHGFGHHVWNLNPTTAYDDVRDTVQLMFMANIFYICAISFTKLSIIVSYLRIFPYTTVRIAMYVTATVTLGLFVSSVPATIFQCNPVSAAWDFRQGNGAAKCFTFVNFLYATTAINVTTDLILCTAPLPYFWNLQLPRRQKVIVSLLFLIGGFACVASILRLPVLHLLATSLDVTWHLGPSVLWTVAECTIGICCVSVPAMRPLFGRLLPDGFLTRRSSSSATGSSSARAARAAAYAMGGWDEVDSSRDGGSGDTKTPATPVDVEAAGASSQTRLVFPGGARMSKSWFTTPLGYGDRQSVGTRGTAFTITTCEASAEVEKPKRVWQKG